ncbi:MAG: ABC transporter permease [Gemmatimonadota bacterium]|nr:ABC transporter permease [Gemmatimonadota bacterium]MDE3172226.1 ABC transporter permease [Gemmatimonadota bacterium]
MLIGEIISVALGALRANKLRSLLTMLGIVIGVAAVIAMVALGSGAQQAVKDRIASLGTTLLSVSPNMQRGFGAAIAGQRRRMTIEDAKALDDPENLPDVIAVEPEMQKNSQVTWTNQNTNTSIIGTAANYLTVRNYKLSSGRMFTEAEDAGQRRVAVVGPTVAQSLGLTTPDALVGEEIRIGGVLFTVIGATEPKGQGSTFGDPDDQILIPLTTGRYRVFGSNWVRSINVLASSEDNIPLAMAEIQKALRRAHRLRQSDPDDFQIRSQTDFLTTTAETTQVFTYLLAGIAGVSLLVGGIGIMNIMLVSVTERTREIGIRKALGATRWNILLQFLIEAVVLCAMGGIVGIALGAGGAQIMSKTAGWHTQVSLAAVGVAFAFSAGVGVIFGVWPARRASVMDPITALRYE